jgi:hypothetical protein
MRVFFVISILLCMLILTGCTSIFQAAPSEKAERYQDNYEIIGEEKEEMMAEMNISKTIFDISDRDNPQVEDTIYFDVNNEEEFTLPPGRYWFSGEISGNIYIYDDEDKLLIHEIIGMPGVMGFTADVDESHTIRIDGLESATAMPWPTETSNELSTGIWHVGTDIEPGTYMVKPAGGFGHVIILAPYGDAQVFEMIGSQASTTESEIELEEGQVIRITGISTVEFKRMGD